jgi:hypothetical protein
MTANQDLKKQLKSVIEIDQEIQLGEILGKGYDPTHRQIIISIRMCIAHLPSNVFSNTSNMMV